MACLNIMKMSQGITVRMNTTTTATPAGANPLLASGCPELIIPMKTAKKITTCTTLMEA
jgi:hypothetical protein